MKKTIFTILAVLTVAVAAEAQTVNLGIKGGLSSAKVSVSEARQNPMMYRDPENITGYHAGLFARLQVMGFMVQPEAMLVSSGGLLTIDRDGDIVEEKLRLTRLDVPIMLGYNFLEIFRVQAGPVASMMLSARQEGGDIKDYLDKSDWGLQAGIGFDISKLTFDVRYERIIREYNDGARNISLSLNNQQFLFSLGYKFVN